MSVKKRWTLKQATDYARRHLHPSLLGAIDMRQFRRGLEVEAEHADTVGEDQFMVAQIAVDHLLEIPTYYTWLDAMEKQAKRAMR